ncbi:hypothetical protein [Actinomadura macrotermitis]|uniref:Prenyltransferase n=1 Tax=Actinomadura macrotermitis TaxID=2585200 RepID=A0A7K0BV62_9ACTN|nr:hypothetical protein [Actinomadura macrotermitis]MQY05037.1 hypothetical protein [Actinomadura macrotermitis]
MSRPVAEGRAQAAASYLLARFPPQSLGLAIVVCALSATLLCALSAPRMSVPAVATTVSTVTLVLLFLLMRLADDLNDLPHDRPPGPERERARGALIRAIVAVIGVAALLNVTRPRAAGVVLATSALVLLTPFVLKHLLRENRLLLLPCYEGGPALALLYVPLAWSDASGIALSVPLTLGITGAFWASYEFWKFSRKAGQDVYQPYDLSDPGLRLVLLGLAALLATCVLAVWRLGGLSPLFPLLGLPGPALLAAAVVRRWPRRGVDATPGWAGLPIVVALVGAVAAEGLWTALR